MQITVRLFAMLRDLVPKDSPDGYSFQVEVTAETSPQNIVDKLNIPPVMAHLVMINGRHLLPEERINHRFQKDEVLSIFPPIAGG
ncbi:MAG: MoaD/ThiS family protein [Deltaproteobacteria bacterium]|nr:MoaD/ThiS family protein [Deltaproteobacteria bacterium]